MDYDVERVRASFPALTDGTAYFDGPGGSQVPRQVAEAIASTMTAGSSNRGAVTPSERRAEDVVVGARAAMADLLGCDPGGVVFGRSMTQLTFDLARALAKTWGPGDEVVVTRLDHDANVRPWLRAADAVGANVRWVDFDTETGELPFDAGVLSERTRLVAVTGASNLLGTRPDIAPDRRGGARGGRAAVRRRGAPHAARPGGRRGTSAADFYACSPYKFFGPHVGVLVADPALLELAPGQAAALHRRRARSGSSSAPCPTSCSPG